jgi:hypothetical protein
MSSNSARIVRNFMGLSGRPIACFGLLLVVTGGATAQRTWVVDGRWDAKYADFTDIQEAIDAASPGDRILVRTRATAIYSGWTLNKGLSLLPDPLDYGVGWNGPAEVRGVPAGQMVTLRRLVNYGPYGLRITDCQGTVCIEWGRADPGELTITNCRHVLINNFYADSVRIESSLVTANLGPTGTANDSRYAIWARNSILVLGNVPVAGYDGNFNPSGCRIDPPAPGLVADNTTLFMGRNTSLRGGWLIANWAHCQPVNIREPAIRGTNVTVFRDPSAQLGPTEGSVTVYTVPLPDQDAQIVYSQAFRMDLDLSAVPGSWATLLVSPPMFPQVTAYGIQWIDPAQHVIVDVGQVDPLGHRKLSFPIPVQYPLGQPMVFQSLVFDGSSVRWSTAPVIVRN